MITVRYMARLREALGTDAEQIALPATVTNLEGLRTLLVSRGGTWAEELARGKRVLVAVNYEMVLGDVPIKDRDEIAFLPPVTGG